MAYIGTMLLMFCNEQEAFTILNYLIENVFPTHFFSNKPPDSKGLYPGMKFERTVIKGMLESYWDIFYKNEYK
jgi:hypothetical protein